MRAVKILALLTIALALLTLPGCYGSRDTDEIAFVLVMGFDKGEKDSLVVTLSIANPRVFAGGGGAGGGEGGGGENGNTINVSFETHAPLTIINLANTVVDRHVSLLHSKAYIFSEELAREGLAQWLFPLNRYRELRETSEVFISRGKAKDFIEKNKPLLEVNPTKQFELIKDLSSIHSLYPSVEFRDIYDNIKSFSTQGVLPLVAIRQGDFETARPGTGVGGDPALGKYIAGEIPSSGGNPAQVCGTAVFKVDKMVGIINGQETRYLMMMRGAFKSGVFSIVDPFDQDLTVGLAVRQARAPKYRTDIDEDGNVAVDLEIFLEPEIISIKSGINYEEPETKPVLEEAISRYIEEECLRLISRTQEEFGSDIFGFGRYVKHNFWTEQSWEEFDWLSRYPDAQVSVTVNNRIRRTGMQLKTTPGAGS